MDTINLIRQKAKAKLKTVILPEYDDERTLKAIEIIKKEGLANIVLLAPEGIDPKEKERYIQEYYQMHQARDVDMEIVRKLFEDTMYYAAMMTAEGKVDGFVAGANHTTPDVARAAIRCIGVDESANIASSCFIMVVPDCPYGDEGTFVFADCGIVPDPTPRQLACISMKAAELARDVLDITPRVALISYSTKGSSKGKSIEKISEAMGLLKEMAPGLLFDGELQVDAAVVPEVAKIKYPDSPLGGLANVLIFPNLEAGNIGYKLVERLGKARALGPLILGLHKPCSDLSRGCSVEDIVDCVAVTAVRCL
jgi:phosphate acetyltransferase